MLQELQNLVNLLGIPSSLNFAVMGGVILVGVIIDQQWGVFRARRLGFGAMRGACGARWLGTLRRISDRRVLACGPLDLNNRTPSE